jgi:hypothetical protein
MASEPRDFGWGPNAPDQPPYDPASPETGPVYRPHTHFSTVATTTEILLGYSASLAPLCHQTPSDWVAVTQNTSMVRCEKCRTRLSHPTLRQRYATNPPNEEL